MTAESQHDRPSISSRSAGPSVDSLELKLTGSSSLSLDLARSAEAEVVVRGVVTGHGFVDKRNGDGDITHTVKQITLKIDELVEISPFRVPRRRAGQTTMGDDGETLDEKGATLAVVREPDEEVVDAEVVGELPPGDGPIVDPETGEVIDYEGGGGDDEYGFENEPLEEPQAPLPDRHPQIPAEAWGELNVEQKHEVTAKVERMEKLAEAHATAANPTDEKVTREKLAGLAAGLDDDFGITLLEPEEIPEAPAEEPPPPPVGPNMGTISSEGLVARRKYLESRTGLPPDAATARDDEIQEIDRRLFEPDYEEAK